MLNFMRHNEAAPLFKEIQHTLLELAERVQAAGARPVRIGFFCNQGRHRSVAAAELLAHVLTHARVRTVVNHLALADRACGCPGQCKSLRRLDAGAAEALSQKWAEDMATAHDMVRRCWGLW
jgi:hypothetical protein